MSIRFILGVDPGFTGAIALYDFEQDQAVDVIDTPVLQLNKTVKILDAGNLAQSIRDWQRVYGSSKNALEAMQFHGVVEAAQSLPGQGVRSVFGYGRCMGALEACLQTLGIPITYVAPAVWKRHFKLGRDKEFSRAKAIQLFPGLAGKFTRKKDHGRCESCLIARYAAGQLKVNSN